MPHLTDIDIVEFLKKCKESLSENGIVIVKENIRSGENFFLYFEEKTLIRTETMFKKLFSCSGLEILKVFSQEDFPEVNFFY